MLVLVRRNRHLYLGPMTLDQFKKRYGALEFGPQDEVCFPYGAWVAIKDLSAHNDAMKELDRLTAENSFQAVSQLPTEIRVTGKTRYWILGLGLAVAIGSFFTYKFLEESQKEQQFLIVQKLFRENRLSELDKHLQNEWEALPKHPKDKRFTKWSPYLRWYFYSRGGQNVSIDERWLRGNLGDTAPESCRVAEWAAEPKGAAAVSWRDRLPLIEPSWVMQRPSQDWKGYLNFWHACIETGFKAGQLLKNPGLTERYRHIQALLIDSIEEPVPPTDLLSSLSCIENTTDFSLFKTCLKFPGSEELQPKLMVRQILQMLRRVSAKANGTEAELDWLKKNGPSLPSIDPFSLLSLQIELEAIKPYL